MMNNIGTILAVMAAFFAQELWKWNTKRREMKKRPKLLNENAKIREEMNDYLNKIQGYLSCSRVCLFEYSNGSYTHSNISLQYVECTSEVTDDSARPIINDFKKTALSPFLKILTQINDSKTGWLKLTDKTGDEDEIKTQKFWRNKTTYNFKITKSVWDGVISINWVHEYVDLTDEQIVNVELLIMRIGQCMYKLVKNK